MSSSSWQREEEEVTTDYSLPCPKNGYYDVFLSFRGQDTRYGFTFYLYRTLLENKVYTFMDVKLMGEDIDYLFEMVAKSRMAVVIYSEWFASSDWCLRELELIMERRKKKKMLMIPIFYKVDVRELKRLTGKTGECLDKHVLKHDETTVQKWRDAITSFGHVSGISYKDTNDRYEYDFIIEVIDKIKKKLGETEEPQESYTYSEEVEVRRRIVESLDVDIKRWSRGKNIRDLLSTLQYVVWPECGWQRVSLTDLNTHANVKEQYRKAALCIHPDKVEQKGGNLLKEAWNKFNSEEL